MNRLTTNCFLTVLILSCSARSDTSIGNPIPTKSGIVGTMDISFDTRLKRGKVGISDRYTFNITVGETAVFDGTIARQPRIVEVTEKKEPDGKSSRRYASEVQPANLVYDIGLSVLNPDNKQQSAQVGVLAGVVLIDQMGVYHIEAGARNEGLQILTRSVGQAPGFRDVFDGTIKGSSLGTGKIKSRSYLRVFGGKVLAVDAKMIDPLEFKDVILAAGPTANYVKASVNGTMDYDYSLSTWFIEDLTVGYQVGNERIQDRISGTIRWVEDDARAHNGKGSYLVNLRFNDAPVSRSDERAVFRSTTSGDDFFEVDEKSPSVTGRIDYVDTFGVGKLTPTKSNVAFRLDCNKITNQQAINLAKILLLVVGPMNDE